ncbi:hypothetical protein CW751_07915 [Brumimicrobium salinarum]|uniref:Uncharacterized protein n=1 Tax=Brumimicrobium salinarum TaxID=2058658 RepID=A0A2I0R291_9FLAO|nr:DUF6157 family protein [Brumimicrobium salinarum]PKR80687.1 hypothetical protein CW751_07915 [Brumimicrobium salinarum]
MKTTNYFNTFIEIAEDCPVKVAEIPAMKGEKKTVALLQFEIIDQHPYRYTSDEVLFTIHALKNDFSPHDKSEMEAYFSKGRACFRASPLGKRYGWGIHYNNEGKMALYGIGSKKYSEFVNDKRLEHVKAMRNKR